MMFWNGLLFGVKCGLGIVALLIALVVIVVIVEDFIDKIKELVGEDDN